MHHSPDSLLAEVLSRLHDVRREGKRYKARCPAHADGTPSLSVRLGDRGILLRCYAGCSHAEVAEAMGFREQELFFDFEPEPTRERERPVRSTREEEPSADESGLTRAAFCEQRKLDESRLDAWGVSDGIVAGKRCVLFAYRSRKGEAGRTRLRTAITGKGRFRWESGETPLIAYEPDGGKLAKEQRRLIVVEGESDTLTLLSAGYPAIGLPGADMSKLLQTGHLESVEHVFVVREPDQGGDTFARQVPLQLERLGWRGPVHTIRMPDEAKDVSALYVRDPAAFGREFGDLLAAQCPPRSKSLESLFACQAEDTEVVRTSFHQLDSACDDGGIPLGKLVVIVGGPGSRKTGCAVQLADDISQQGCAVLMVCADEGRKNVVTRLGQRLGFSQAGLRDRTEIGHATRAEAARREAALGRVLRFAELDDAEDAQTIEDAHMELISVAKGRPRVLIVDSLQTCRSEAAEALERPDPRQEIDRKMRALRSFRRTGTLVIIVSETRRGFYASTDRRVEKEDVVSAAKESGGVEFGADMVIGLVRDREDENRLEMVVAKSRFGTEPRFKLQWNRPRATLEELTPRDVPHETSAPGRKRSPRDVLRAEVYDLIVRHPGLSEKDVRAMLGRSRVPVREALEELTVAGRIAAARDGRGRITAYTAVIQRPHAGEGGG